MMPNLPTKKKSIFIIASTTSVIALTISVWILFFPHAAPRFEVVDFKGVDVETGHAWWWGGTSCQIEFKLMNAGQRSATHIHGTLEVTDSAHLRAKYATWTRGVVLTKTWSLPNNFVLGPGETSRSVVIPLDELPTDTSVTVTVECDEGITHQFVKSP